MKLTAPAACGVMALALVGTLTACGHGTSGSSSSDGITIGASIPLSGTLASFGSFEKWGYQHAVDAVNKTGGIKIGGVKRKVKLIILDDQTDPNRTVNNVQRLITSDHVDALLGSCTDSLVEPGALIADRAGVPLVTGCAATNTFGTTKKWKWAWDLFFNSDQLTETPFNTIDELGLKTNKKVAILHSNGKNENVIGGEEWPKWAAKHGFTVVYNAAFPPDTSQFSSALAKIKATGADVLLSVFGPPSSIALRKQMVSAGYSPKMTVMEEGAEPVQFATALGRLANGVMVGGYWDPSFPYAGAKTLTAEFEVQTHQTSSQHIADTSTAAQILIDAITRAGTTDKAKVNAEIGRTDATYVVGRIKFGADHTATLPMVEDQWHNGKTVVIAPAKEATGKVLFPLPTG
ncbi:amino acid ABC transporter substrate-binding protein [Streptomyces sp. NPDC059373]